MEYCERCQKMEYVKSVTYNDRYGIEMTKQLCDSCTHMYHCNICNDIYHNEDLILNQTDGNICVNCMIEKNK